MDTLTETIATVNDTTLKAINSLQDQVLSFHRDVAAAYAKAIDVPSWVPSPEPLADVKVDELVRQAYDFQAQRVEADKQFALDIVQIWAPKPPKATKSAK
jgi:hypothetical protein